MEKSPHQRPANFNDKVLVYKTLAIGPEVIAELSRLANGGRGSTHFGEDWTPEDFEALLEELGRP